MTVMFIKIVTLIVNQEKKFDMPAGEKEHFAQDIKKRIRIHS